MDTSGPGASDTRFELLVHEGFEISAGSIGIANESICLVHRTVQPHPVCLVHSRFARLGKTDRNEVMDHPHHLAPCQARPFVKVVEALWQPPRRVEHEY